MHLLVWQPRQHLWWQMLSIMQRINLLKKQKKRLRYQNYIIKDVPIDLEQAVRMLEDCGLKSSTSKLTIKEANPRYKDCFDSQVIGSNPKQGTVVKIGSTVCLRYIPDEVIIESQKIFDELQRNKKESKERTRENLSVVAKRTKQSVTKIFKRNNKEKIIGEDMPNE